MCQALGWLRTLYTGLAKNIKFEILGCLKALEDCYEGRTFPYQHFLISKRNMEKYRTSGRLIILSLVASLQERQRHNKDGKLQFKKIDE